MSRRATVLDLLLAATIGFVAVVAAAYVWMPELRRAVRAVVEEAAGS